MKIAVLGWGSLIWDKDNLQIQSSWREDGPFLPIEFARISKDGRLTLVLYPYAHKVRVLWALSEHQDLDCAIENLCQREDTIPKRIGYISIQENKINCQTAPNIEDCTKDWAKEKGLNAVIWTDLQSNFVRKTETVFTEENVIAYLFSLSKEKLENAETYIRRAPKQIITKMRPLIEKRLAALKSQ